MGDIFWWLNVIYFMPLYVSALYFTILKLEDEARETKVFSKDKFTYAKMIKSCFIPIINILLMFVAIKSLFKKVDSL